ncbi:MAG: hypothetical protein IJC88_03380 [Oscillospiraceae bacterium]|nr:hypothetical protein [Oscillospiraceae bacterium]
MAWSRVKNLLIAMLVAVNVFLLVVYGLISWRENRNLEQVNRDLLSVADSLGVDLPEHLIRTEVQTLYPMQVYADREADRLIAESLLGVCEETVREDGSFLYRSQAGNLCFFADNIIELELAISERMTDEADARRLVKKILGQLGQTYESVVAEETSSGQDFLFTVPLAVSGMSVFDSVLTFEITPGLISVSGQRVLHRPKQLRLDEVQELPGVLLCLFRYWEEKEILLQTITDIELGYLAENRKGERLNLLPVWHIAVESGDWYVSALDGSIVTP